MSFRFHPQAGQSLVKICGLRTLDTLAAARDAGAAALGFVFFAASPRAVTPDQVGAWSEQCGAAARVGVFVDPDDALLDRAVQQGKITHIQLHKVTSPARMAAIRQRFSQPLIAAFGLATAADRTAANAFTSLADWLLFDAPNPGHGTRFDWHLLETESPPVPWGLSGGLDDRDVGAAITRLRPHFVDVSSGVETAPGVKSAEKIIAFCKAAQRA